MIYCAIKGNAYNKWCILHSICNFPPKIVYWSLTGCVCIKKKKKEGWNENIFLNFLKVRREQTIRNYGAGETKTWNNTLKLLSISQATQQRKTVSQEEQTFADD